jgi:hypothetical protein
MRPVAFPGAFLTLTAMSTGAAAVEARAGVPGDSAEVSESVAVESESERSQVTMEGAELRPESGFQHALRLGFSVPAGESADGRALSEDVTYRVPVVLEIGYRTSHTLYVGLMGVAGIDAASDECGLTAGVRGASCTFEGWRLGAEALLYPLDREAMDLWLGAALGWEVIEQKALVPDPTNQNAFGGSRLQSEESGPALDLQAGIDFRVEGKLAAGPFLNYTGGMYVVRSTDCPDTASCPSDIDEAGIHHWLTLGVRGRFGP